MFDAETVNYIPPDDIDQIPDAETINYTPPNEIDKFSNAETIDYTSYIKFIKKTCYTQGNN